MHTDIPHYVHHLDHHLLWVFVFLAYTVLLVVGGYCCHAKRSLARDLLFQVAMLTAGVSAYHWCNYIGWV